MDFKKTIFEACAAVPSMGSAIAAAYDCIFEASVGTAQASSIQVQNGGTSQNDVAIDPAAITENPESAKILADIATKASQQQQQVEQAQQQLEQRGLARAILPQQDADPPVFQRQIHAGQHRGALAVAKAQTADV